MGLRRSRWRCERFGVAIALLLLVVATRGAVEKNPQEEEVFFYDEVIVVDAVPHDVHDVIDKELPRTKKRKDEACHFKLLSPADALQIYFRVGDMLNVTLEIVCDQDKLHSWLLARPPGRRGIAGSIMLDHDTLANFTLPDVLSALSVRVFTVPFQVVQWYETNIVLHSGQKAGQILSDENATGLMDLQILTPSRTVALQRTKHHLFVVAWFATSPRREDMARLEILNASCSVILPFILEPAPLLEDGLTLLSPPHNASVPEHEEIDVVMRVTTNFTTPSAFSVQLYLGSFKAVRLWPEWQLPKHGDSNATALLHVTVAYRPNAGKYPVWKNLWIRL